MQEILILDVLVLAIHFCWLVVQLVRIARSNQQSHCLPLKQSIWQLLMQQKKQSGFADYLKTLDFHKIVPRLFSVITRVAYLFSRNPTFHARTKHVEIQHHFVHDKIENGDIDLVFRGTQDMVADVLTKSLTCEKHYKFKEMMVIIKLS